MAVKLPQYRLKRGRGILDAPFQYDTPFNGAYVYSTGLTLNENGKLTCATGYTWDFGSGPAIDTPDMVYGSLAHDALYDMAQHHSWDAVPYTRREADKYFKDLLKEAGMGWFRRQYVYWAVRVGYPFWKAVSRG
jgi:hypothetical protein